MESVLSMRCVRLPQFAASAFSRSPSESFPPNLNARSPLQKVFGSQFPGVCTTLLSRRIGWVSGPKRRCLQSSGCQADGENCGKGNEELEGWDSLTAKFAAAANLPFLLLQTPQILLNYRNLLMGNKRALFAVPWIGMLTGLLGNLSLLSYFAKKRETEAVIVQTLGVISTYIVLVQLVLADAMPIPHFIATSTVVVCGLIVNLLNYFSRLSPIIWTFWEDFITVGGVSVLPQVMWSTFVPYIPHSILPGTFAFLFAVITVVMEHNGNLSKAQSSFVTSISGWTATILFMWMAVAQMWTNYLNPGNIKGLSVFSLVLAMIGNGLLIPRALFIRDFMWFSGSAWSCFLYGWSNLLWLHRFKSISSELFCAATLGLFTWIGITLWRDSKVYGYSSPLLSLRDLKSGRCNMDRKSLEN